MSGSILSDKDVGVSRAIESTRTSPCGCLPKVLEPERGKKHQCHVNDSVTSSSQKVFLNSSHCECVCV